ncbi:hypothetical protein D9M71_229820 [compost metagenome]
MRAQHGQVVGDVLRVGRADADVHQGHAVAVAGDQVVGRHLEAVPFDAGDDGIGLARVHAALDDHVARQHHAHEARVVAQARQAGVDELVDVAVVVGQQDPRLHVAPVAAGVVHQAAQGEIHPRGVEQRQRHGVGVLPLVQAVGDAVGGGGQVGAGEHPRQLGGGHAGTGQFVALLDHVGIGDVLLAGADLHPHGEVLHQRPQLLQQVFAEGRRLGDGHAVVARHLHLGEGAGGRGHLALAEVGQTQQRIAEQRALPGIGRRALLQVALERLAQGTGGSLMQCGQLIDGLFGGLGDEELVASRESHGWHPV